MSDTFDADNFCDMTPPKMRERTHWDGCWQERTHHDCALARIAALEAELAAEREIVDRIWAIFGSPDYESLSGRSIYDLINAERERREAAEKLLQDAYSAIFEDADVNDVRAQIDAHFARYKD